MHARKWVGRYVLCAVSYYVTACDAQDRVALPYQRVERVYQLSEPQTSGFHRQYLANRGRYVAVSGNGKSRLWDLATKEIIFERDTAAWEWPVSTDGQTIFSRRVMKRRGENWVEVYLNRYDETWSSTRLSPGGNYLINSFSSPDRRQIVCLPKEPNEKAIEYDVRLPGMLTGVAPAADKNRFVALTWDPQSFDVTLRECDVETGAERRNWLICKGTQYAGLNKNHVADSEHICAVARCESGRMSNALLYDKRAGRQLSTAKHPPTSSQFGGFVGFMELSPDGKYLLLRDDPRREFAFYVYDTATGELISGLANKIDGASYLHPCDDGTSFSEDGQSVFAISDKYTVYRWYFNEQ